MSKKSFTFFILFLLALFAGLAWYFLFRTIAPAQTKPTANGTPSKLFPFGTKPTGAGGTQTPTGGKISSTTIDLSLNSDGTVSIPRLRQISLVPTAGAVAYDIASSTLIRYIERATGHIYQTDSLSTNVVKVSNVTLPKIHEALWSKDGGKLLIRYIKDGGNSIRTFYAKISTSSPETALEGYFLPDSLASVSVQGDKIFYLDESASGAQGISANIDGSKKVAVFNSTFGDWSSVWSTPGIITLFPRPSGLAVGSAYALNSTTGEYSKVVSSTLGLTAVVNSDGTLVLYSGSDGKNSLGTAVTNVKDGSSKSLAISTLTDKCIWSRQQKNIVYCAVPKSIPDGLYPDDWYKGKTSFSDAMWKINAATGETTDVFDPELEAGVSIDITSPSLDQSESVLLFTNKNDMTVWSYKLTE